jgi:hypothetical protein
MCKQCSKIAEEETRRAIPFLFSDNEKMSDQCITLKNINSRQGTELERSKSELEGCNWIIKEKDTEMRIINKEKDDLLQKMLEARIEIVQ